MDEVRSFAVILPSLGQITLWRYNQRIEPGPTVVTPGATCTAAPSDAIVLFGKNQDEWVSVRDKSPAKWTVADGTMTVSKGEGSIETKRSFKNYQLHSFPGDILTLLSDGDHK